MGLTRISLASALATTTFFAAVASADAAIRHAAPSSVTTSGLCTAVAPCRLDFAVNGAASGDTVVLAPGSYTVNYAVAPTMPVHVTGTAGMAAPTLEGAASLAGATINLSYGGSLKHVDVESHSANPGVVAKGAVIENVVVHAVTGSGIVAKAGAGATIRDSLVHTVGPASALVLTDDQITGNLDVVNVTSISAGAGSAAITNGSGGVVSIVNTIARGHTKDITETAAVQDAQVSYSNFRPGMSDGVVAGSGNQSGDPTFADALYRAGSGSVTIDAGTAGVASLGSLDPDGNLRVLGGLPDIGAYEYTGAGGGNGVVLPDPGSGSTDPGTTTDPGAVTDPVTDTDTDELPPSARPVLGRNVDLGAVSGTVRVTLPGSGQPVVLEDGANVPVGSVIDATEGVVSLTSVRDGNGQTQTGRFWGGAFRVGQSRTGDQYTVLTLVGAINCSAREKASAAGRRASRRLWGSDNHGRFRTRGRRGQATVRGTKWLTEDRCGGTYFRVKRGAISVRDFGTRRNVKLTRGESYLARTR